MRPRRSAASTTVTCPGCEEGALTVHRYCLRTPLECDRCRHLYTLAELAGLLADEPFAELAEAVGDRLSDRI